MWAAIMLAGRAPRTGTLMDRCGEARTQGAKIAFDVGMMGSIPDSDFSKPGKMGLGGIPDFSQPGMGPLPRPRAT